MRILLALFVAALVVMGTPAKNIHNSTSSLKKQTVQSETWRNMSTLVYEQEKDLTKQQLSVEPEEVAKVETPVPQPTLTEHEQLMQAAGISQNDWADVDYIVSRESSWNTAATNPSSGAYGLCQALPKEKMASAGDDYNSNPVTQLKWCQQYAHSRYNGWTFAASFWSTARWW